MRLGLIMSNVLQFKSKPKFTFTAKRDEENELVSLNGIKLNETDISFGFENDGVYLGQGDEHFFSIPIEQFNEVVSVFMEFHTMPEPTKEYQAIMDDDDHYLAECCSLGVLCNAPDDFVWKLGDPLFSSARKLGLSPQYVLHKLFGGAMKSDD